MNSSKIYFPNLNGLRFIVALMVIIHHIEQIKFIYKAESLWCNNAFIMAIGKLGVYLFFVLSGFLITYLLLVEEREYKKISIKNFYMRRILRIWPLYFFVIFMALYILPHFSFLSPPNYRIEIIQNSLFLKTILYVFFLPNLVPFLLGVIPFATHSWSIGTEEQFYLMWPIIIKYMKKKIKLAIFIIISIYLAIKGMLFLDAFQNFKGILIIRDFWNSFAIDLMAIGSLFAILLFEKHSLLKILLNKNVFYIVLCLTIILIGFGINIPYIHSECYSILFGVIILNFASNVKTCISLENRVLHYLGKISYGLYMYHPLCIILTYKILQKTHIYNSITMIVFSLIVTAITASVSYEFFELKLINLKVRFTTIISGENALSKTEKS